MYFNHGCNCVFPSLFSRAIVVDILSCLKLGLFPLFHVTNSLFDHCQIRGSWIRLRVRVVHASGNISGLAQTLQAAVHEYCGIPVVVHDTGFHKGTAFCMMGGSKLA